MKSHNWVERLKRSIRKLPRRICECKLAAETLVEVGRTWTRRDRWFGWLWLSDHDRARAAVLHNLGNIRDRSAVIRSGQIHPQAIQAAACAEDVRGCCRKCLAHNRDRLNCGQEFECLAETYLDDSCYPRLLVWSRAGKPIT